MSFSVHNPQTGLEYNGHTLTSLFAQRRNLVNPSFWRLLGEIVRFNRLAKQALESEPDPHATLQTFLDRHRFTPFFARHYILPMGAAIWSSSLQEMKRFPLPLFLRFFDNHGLLDVTHRPQWYVVPGGSREYIRAMMDKLGDRLTLHLNAPVQRVIRQQNGVTIQLDNASHSVDQVILPVTPGRRWRCLTRRARLSRTCWAISAGSVMRWCFTAIRAGYRYVSVPGELELPSEPAGSGQRLRHLQHEYFAGVACG